ncbi:MAG: hypothetical protein Q8P41_05125 [Pseudomonadota bacterium]|nr:hypothetical protein [Pseudomonadota bacterium]
MALLPAWPRRSAPLERALGAALLLLVVWVYSQALEHERWPPGHPWSGLTLALLGLLPLFWPGVTWSGASRASLVARFAVIGMALVGAVLWYLSAQRAAPVHLGL